MSCDNLPGDLRILWKEAGKDRPMFSLEQIREDTEKLLARRRRSYAVVGACMAVFVASFTLCFFLFSNTLTRIGSVVAVLGFGYWFVDLLVERARAVPDLGETDGVRFYRGELEQMRDWHRRRRWRLLILPLPFIFFDLGCSQIYGKHFPFLARFVWFDGALMLAVFAIWAPLKHLKLARQYQGKIEALDAGVKGG